MYRVILFLVLLGTMDGQVIDISRFARNYGTHTVTRNFTSANVIPPLPVLGPANSIFKDPSFGNRILRVTDGNTLTPLGGTNFSLSTPSSAESSIWRKDGTMFYLGSPAYGVPALFSFDPVTFQAHLLSTTDLERCCGGDPEFSYTDNNALYGAFSLKFVRHDLATGATATLLNFSTAGVLAGSNGDPSVSATEILVAPTNGPQQDYWTANVAYCVVTGPLCTAGQFAVMDFTRGIRGFGQSSFTPQTPGPAWNNPAPLNPGTISACPFAPFYPTLCVPAGGGGSGYAVNDTGTISGCGNGAATYTVTAVSAGVATALNITGGGAAYTYTLNCSTSSTTGSGSGLVINIPSWGIHNARVGKEGRYVVTGAIGSGTFAVIWDLQTMTTAYISANNAGGHKAQGYGTLISPGPVVGQGNNGPSLVLTNLSAPNSPINLLPYNPNGTYMGGVSDYQSMQNSDANYPVPVFGSTNSAGVAGIATNLANGEIVAAEADQVRSSIWQFANTRSPFGGPGGFPSPLFTGAVSVSSSGGGMGYAPGDTGTVTGCGPGAPPYATYSVTAASGGVVSAITITYGGGYYNTATGCTTSATTGSGTGLRLDISPSLWSIFSFTTRGAVSQDGKYFAFTSVWEGTLGADPSPGYGTPNFRTDVFVVELTPLTPQMGGQIIAGSTKAVFSTLAPDMEACTATVYRDSARTTAVSSAADTVRDGRTSQIVVSGLTPGTPYWTKVACGGGNGTLLASFTTHAAGSGTYRFPFLLPSSQAMTYCADAAMSTGCTTLSPGTKHSVPVAASAVAFAKVGATGSIKVLVAP